ncbi:hypothetical protein IW262DRAFT_1303034 [Armillaria fumosa]|nr:hypothetical protein IW262DRAFT_1303034 [Armillaria fumosa]
MLTKYHIEKTIKSPQAAVLCLATTEKGQFLASGDQGYDCTSTHMTLHGYVSVSIQNCDARAIYFLLNGESRNMMVFGCHSGKMYSIHSNRYLLRGNDGSVIESYDTGGIIGNATVNAAKDVFGIDDPSQGVALYRVLDGAKTANVDGISTIVAASSRDVGTEMSKIYIWKKQSQPLSTPETTEDDTLTLACKNWLIIVLLITLLTLNSQLIASGEAESNEGDMNIVPQHLGQVHESLTGIEQKKEVVYRRRGFDSEDEDENSGGTFAKQVQLQLQLRLDHFDHCSHLPEKWYFVHANGVSDSNKTRTKVV